MCFVIVDEMLIILFFLTPFNLIKQHTLLKTSGGITCNSSPVETTTRFVQFVSSTKVFKFSLREPRQTPQLLMNP